MRPWHFAKFDLVQILLFKDKGFDCNTTVYGLWIFCTKLTQISAPFLINHFTKSTLIMFLSFKKEHRASRDVKYLKWLSLPPKPLCRHFAVLIFAWQIKCRSQSGRARLAQFWDACYAQATLHSVKLATFCASCSKLKTVKFALSFLLGLKKTAGRCWWHIWLGATMATLYKIWRRQ